MSATILDAFEYAISQGYAGTQAEFTALMSLALKYEKTTRKDLGIVTAYGYAKYKGYTGTEEEFAELMASYATVAEEAADSASEAEGYAEDSQEWSVESEAWATGQRNGVDVDSEDETYQNNSKYYAEQAQDSADAAAVSAATFTTDIYLQTPGKAADAKKTGDEIEGLKAAISSPLVITDPDDFEDANHQRVYVYAGTTTALYTEGDWYYWDGDGWESGGPYNSVAVYTDDTLSVQGQAADAAAVGVVADDVTDLKNALSDETYNLVDITTFYGDGITRVGNELIGTAYKFSAASTGSAFVDVSDLGYGNYTLSFDAYNEQDIGTSGEGLIVYVYYNDTHTNEYCSNSWDSWHHFSRKITNFTPIEIRFSYSSNSGNIWHIKNIQLTKTDTELPYRPHLTARDVEARDAIEQLQDVSFNNTQAISNKILLTDNDIFYPYLLKSGKTYTYTNNSDKQVYVGFYSTEDSSTNVYGSYISKDNTITFTSEVNGNYVRVLYGNEGTTEVIVIEEDTLDYRIGENKERIDSLDGVIPSYYQSVMDTKIPLILNHMAEVGDNGDTFIFITDVHWSSNDKKSPALVKYILKNTTIQDVICGGDLIEQGTVDAMRKDMIEVINSFQFPNHNFYVAFGNHDSNWNAYGGQREHPERYFDMDAVYAYMFKELDGKVEWFGDTDFSYWYDNKSCKTRYICVDTGEDDIDYRYFTNFAKLYDVIMDVPNGWSVIVIAHIITYGIFTSEIEPFLDAYNARGIYDVYNFANAKGKVQMCIGGHMHIDSDHLTSGGIPIIATSTDARNTSASEPYPYEAKSANSQCIDVVTVDYVAKKVYCVRVGHGVDRTISY